MRHKHVTHNLAYYDQLEDNKLATSLKNHSKQWIY